MQNMKLQSAAATSTPTLTPADNHSDTNEEFAQLEGILALVRALCQSAYLQEGFPRAAMPPRKRAAKSSSIADTTEDPDPKKLKVAELKAELKKRGLDATGSKAELVARLHDALEPPSKKTKEEVKEETDVGRAVSAFKEEAKEAAKTPKKPRQHKVDRGLYDCAAYKSLGDFNVLDDWDCMLNQTNIGQNNNKYYIVQLLYQRGVFGGMYHYVWTRWGRVGEPGANALKGPMELSLAENEFKKKFTDKTKNKWEQREQFTAVPGKYTLLEMADDSDDEEMDAPAPSTSGPTRKVKPCNLDKPTQKLVNLIFDTDMFQDAMKSFDIDTKKMPLGKLSKAQIAKGFEILEEIEAALKSGTGSGKLLSDLSSRFYTAIPHDFGRRVPPPINSEAMLQEKFDMLVVLGDIELAQTMQSEKDQMTKDVAEEPHPLDVKYGLLRAKLESLGPKDEEFQMIQKYVECTGSPVEKKNLQNVWRVDREGEGDRFSKHAHLDNRKLLWHGTNVAVVAAILKTGLRIMPHSGGRVGSGIYFASEQRKSAAYVWPTRNTCIMFLNEVALGKPKEIVQDDRTLKRAPPGFDSVVARGQTEPDPKNDSKLTFDGRGVTVPQGKPVAMKQFSSSHFWQSEYLVYQESQVRIRYLLTFRR